MKQNLKTLLAERIGPNEADRIYRSFDIIGDIAVVRVPPDNVRHACLIAETIMEVHSRVKSVWRRTSAVKGRFRLCEVEWLAGEERTITLHKEYGCTFKVDISKCYFSNRLAYERMRVAQQVASGEEVLNMFAGVGCYSIVISKHSEAKKIFSIDLNPVAFSYMKENVDLNGVEDQMVCIQGDAIQLVKSEFQEVFNRVLMPLPEEAYLHIDTALSALKPEGGVIHYYDFQHAGRFEDPVGKAVQNISEKLQDLKVGYKIVSSRIVRTTGPRWFQVALDIHVC